jgi:pRiA4b ORF-3-like protein
MIAQIEPAARLSGTQAYQIQVFLGATQPLIWRRLQVQGNANLGWLHAVLQVAMGWTNSHLHQFICGEHVYADPSPQLEQYGGDPPVLDERKATLSEVAPGIRDVLVYEYDFGDSWEHMVIVEKILNAPPSLATTALCLAGARACPPEDCGGAGGYEELLKALKIRKHPEHKSMKEWLGRPFNAEVFDLAKTNTWLRKLKWPRVTEGQLRKVLMARDGYHG